jgi:hypothetical protein
MAEPFATMTPARRAFMVEDTRFLLHRISAEHGFELTADAPLSKPTAAWLRRLQTSLVDHECSDEAFRQINLAALAAVPAEEVEELSRRRDLFAEVRDLTPHGATCAEEALPAVCRGLAEIIRRKQEALK